MANEANARMEPEHSRFDARGADSTAKDGGGCEPERSDWRSWSQRVHEGNAALFVTGGAYDRFGAAPGRVSPTAGTASRGVSSQGAAWRAAGVPRPWPPASPAGTQPSGAWARSTRP